MKFTDKGAHLSTRELIALQVLLEAAIEQFEATVRGVLPAKRQVDKETLREFAPLLKQARTKWRAIENTHIARQATTRRPR